MTRARRARARRPVLGVIDALKSGDNMDYSPASWETLLGAVYFGDHGLTDDELREARKLLDRWREQHHRGPAG